MSGAPQRWVDRLAHVPSLVIGGLLVLGAVLADTHESLVRYWHGNGLPEWEQWVGRLTVQSYWILLPLALLALWSRHRRAMGRLGRLSAALLLPGPVVHVALAVAAVVWGGLLGRGDLPAAVMAAEFLGVLTYLGIIGTGVALLRTRDVPRTYGALVLVGFVGGFFLAWIMSGAFALLAVLVVRHGRAPARVKAGVRPVPAGA
jgi:hypothetical protein